MIPAGQLTGAVLAGGDSSRMGHDKAALVIGASPLWQRQVLVLRAAGAALVGVVRRPGQSALGLPPEIGLWLDSAQGIGPLAGLHAALLACPTGWLAVVATDMPRIQAGWFQWLAGYCAPGCGAVARHRDGLFEPLAAIYPQEALPEVTARLAGPDYSLQSLATALMAHGRMTSVPLPDAELGQIENWNTPADVP